MAAEGGDSDPSAAPPASSGGGRGWGRRAAGGSEPWRGATGQLNEAGTGSSLLSKARTPNTPTNLGPRNPFQKPPDTLFRIFLEPATTRPGVWGRGSYGLTALSLHLVRQILLLLTDATFLRCRIPIDIALQRSVPLPGRKMAICPSSPRLHSYPTTFCSQSLDIRPIRAANPPSDAELIGLDYNPSAASAPPHRLSKSYIHSLLVCHLTRRLGTRPILPPVSSLPNTEGQRPRSETDTRVQVRFNV